MKIAILHGPRDLRIEEQRLDTESLDSHEIWVKTEISALKIGTDRGNYEGAEQVPGAPGYPRWVGDSNLGVVKGVGNNVSRVKVGDRIVTRQYHQSEFIMPETASLVKVPEGVHAEDAVYAHIYALSAHCYHKAHFRPGENVAVVGVGVLGLGAIAIGPLFGANVVALANSPVRLEMAERMGAHAGLLVDDPDLTRKLDDFTHGRGIDLVILTANPWPALRTSMQVVRPNGRVSIVSLVGRGEPPLDFNPLAMELFYNKGISLIAVSGPAGYQYPDAGPMVSVVPNFYEADRTAEHMLSLMADGKLEPKRLITHRFHYTEIVKAYEMAYHREKSMLGVIFNWQEAD
ncbi:MAG: zinc-binding alcohol dehydrogenase [Chloroflexota bacterium]